MIALSVAAFVVGACASSGSVDRPSVASSEGAPAPGATSTVSVSQSPVATPSAAPRVVASPAASRTATWQLVALGDSGATGAGDEEGTGWVQRYAALIRQQDSEVIVINAARNGTTSGGLANRLKTSSALRSQIAASDIVVLSIGGADLNHGDDAWAAGKCVGPPCYEAVFTTFAANVDAIASEVAGLRAGRPTAIRALTFPNGYTGAEDVLPRFLVASATEVGVFQARRHAEITCAAMAKVGGKCVELLEPFNGADGTRDAYAAGLMNHEQCCYPSAAGQQLIAELLLASGLPDGAP